MGTRSISASPCLLNGRLSGVEEEPSSPDKPGDKPIPLDWLFGNCLLQGRSMVECSAVTSGSRGNQQELLKMSLSVCSIAAGSKVLQMPRDRRESWSVS